MHKLYCATFAEDAPMLKLQTVKYSTVQYRTVLPYSTVRMSDLGKIGFEPFSMNVKTRTTEPYVHYT